jgi:glutamate transport system substrate-binding protein
MRLTRRGRLATTGRAAAALVLAAGLALTACGPNNTSFPPGTTMYRLHRAGFITIGVKVDQPGFGFRNLVTKKLEGFDIRIAELIAAGLGLSPRQIHFVEAISRERETLLQNHQVNLIVATYSITPDREKKVGQAGPYYTTGQRLLVRKADQDKFTRPADLANRKVCTVRGSTSLENIANNYPDVQVMPADYYTKCVQLLLGGAVDAVTTDDAVLAVYVAQERDKLAVVGKPFSVEEYGVGYPKGDYAFCQYITNVLRQAINDGSWRRAFDDTLGKASVKPPDPLPAPRDCLPAQPLS